MSYVPWRFDGSRGSQVALISRLARPHACPPAWLPAASIRELNLSRAAVESMGRRRLCPPIRRLVCEAAILKCYSRRLTSLIPSRHSFTSSSSSTLSPPWLDRMAQWQAEATSGVELTRKSRHTLGHLQSPTTPCSPTTSQERDGKTCPFPQRAAAAVQ